MVYPVEVLVIEGFSKPTKFQADSIFTIDKEELGERITELSPLILWLMLTQPFKLSYHDVSHKNVLESLRPF
jgi:hypothetical protein